MPQRPYRSKLEILRDVLAAAKQGDTKTRIMCRAYLNSSSFERYLAYCLEHDLLLRENGGFQLTPRAEQTLQAINVVLNRGSQLEEAVQDLIRVAGNSHEGPNRSLVLSPSFSLGMDFRLPPWLSGRDGSQLIPSGLGARRRR